MKDSLDALSLYARQKENLPDDWYGYLFEVKESPFGRFFEVTGKCCPLVTKGERKGKPNWKKGVKSTIKTVQVSPDEYQTWLKQLD